MYVCVRLQRIGCLCPKTDLQTCTLKVQASIYARSLSLSLSHTHTHTHLILTTYVHRHIVYKHNKYNAHSHTCLMMAANVIALILLVRCSPICACTPCSYRNTQKHTHTHTCLMMAANVIALILLVRCSPIYVHTDAYTYTYTHTHAHLSHDGRKCDCPDPLGQVLTHNSETVGLVIVCHKSSDRNARKSNGIVLYVCMYVCKNACMFVFVCVLITHIIIVCHKSSDRNARKSNGRILYVCMYVCMCVCITHIKLVCHKSSDSNARKSNGRILYVCIYVCMYVRMYNIHKNSLPRRPRLQCPQILYLCVCMYVPQCTHNHTTHPTDLVHESLAQTVSDLQALTYTSRGTHVPQCTHTHRTHPNDLIHEPLAHSFGLICPHIHRRLVGNVQGPTQGVAP
jgi:hypothetical protein